MDCSNETRGFEPQEHDQLPDVEEYKANIGFGAKKSLIDKPDPDGHDGIFLSGEQQEFAIDDDEEDVIIQEDYRKIPRLGKYKTSRARLPWSAKCWKLCATLSFFTLLATLGILLSSPQEEYNFWHFIQGETNGYRAVKQYVTEVAKLTDPSIFIGPASPQYFAAQWLAHGDGLNLAVPSQLDPQYSQRYAMVVLYFSLNGPQWTHQYNFLSADHVCAWYQEFEIITNEDEDLDQEFKIYGVHGCKQEDADFGLVPHALYLPSNGLNGTLPAEMDAFTKLESIEIESNDGLIGTLPSVLREMTSLKRIMLQFCSLEGTIPTWIGELTQLQYLGLGGNAFYGDLPTELGSLTGLQLLGLDRNQMSGNIDIFSSMTVLKGLYLDSNLLTGQITVEWMQMHQILEELDISDNVISGILPENFFDSGNQPYLQVIDLHGNQLVGAIPSPYSQNNVLKFLALQQNKLENAVRDLYKLKALEHLDLSDNRLTGRLPETLGLISNLRYLFTGTNRFDEGRIPSWLLQLTNLRELSMKENSLTGIIPGTIFDYLTKLQFLDFHLNGLTGQIPQSISSLTDLRHLLLKMNKLEGTIPDTMNELTNLQVLLLEQNSLTGDTHAICSSPNVGIEAFVSDCADDPPQIICTCCTTCCIVADAMCNTFDFQWKGNLDPVSHYGYRRQRYSYDTEMTIVP